MARQLSFFDCFTKPEDELLEWLSEFKDGFNRLMPIVKDFMLTSLKAKVPPDESDWESRAEEVYNEYEDVYDSTRSLLEGIESLVRQVRIKMECETEEIQDGKTDELV